MKVQSARSVFYDAEWHREAPVPIVASTRDKCASLLSRLHRTRVIDERGLAYMRDNGYMAETVSFMIRYQQYSVAGGYMLKHYLSVGADRTKPERICLLQYGRGVVALECGTQSVNELVQELLIKNKVKKQCVIAVRTRAELRLVCIACMGGLSYVKRSELASLSLARMLVSSGVDNSFQMMAINEQSKGSMWLQTGKYKDCYKVHLPVSLSFSGANTKSIGSVIFATYYTSFVIRGGSYGTRGFLRIVRLFYKSSFFCQESVEKPRLMVQQMKKICPAEYALLYVGHDVTVKVFSGMSEIAVDAVFEDYSVSMKTGSSSHCVVSVL